MIKYPALARTRLAEFVENGGRPYSEAAQDVNTLIEMLAKAEQKIERLESDA